MRVHKILRHYNIGLTTLNEYLQMVGLDQVDINCNISDHDFKLVCNLIDSNNSIQHKENSNAQNPSINLTSMELRKKLLDEMPSFEDMDIEQRKYYFKIICFTYWETITKYKLLPSQRRDIYFPSHTYSDKSFKILYGLYISGELKEKDKNRIDLKNKLGGFEINIQRDSDLYRFIRRNYVYNIDEESLEEQKYHIGIIKESTPLKDGNECPPRTIVFFVFTVGRQLRYFISEKRADLDNGTLVLFALDKNNTIKITECIPVHFDRRRKKRIAYGRQVVEKIATNQVYVYPNIDHGNDSLCEKHYMTQEWIDKISSHSYTLFAYNGSGYHIYYKCFDSNGELIENVHNLYYEESECIVHYLHIKDLEKQNLLLKNKSAFEEEECLPILTKKIEEFSEQVNMIDIDSIVSDYHIYIDTNYITKIGGDDRIYVYMKSKEDKRIDSYLSRLLPSYYEQLYEDHGFCNLYTDLLRSGELDNFNKQAKELEEKHKKDFFEKYDKQKHISTMLCHYMDDKYKKMYAPSFKRKDNEIEIEKSQDWLSQHFLGELYYTVYYLKSEDEVIDWVTNYNK